LVAQASSMDGFVVHPMEPSGLVQSTCTARPPLQRRTPAAEEAKKVERQRLLEEWKKERYARQSQRGAGGARFNLRGKENRAANGSSAALARKLCPRGRKAAGGNACPSTPKPRAHVNAVSPLAEIFQHTADIGSSSQRGSDKQGTTTPRPIVDDGAKARGKPTFEEVTRVWPVFEELVPCPPGTPRSPSTRYKPFDPITMNGCHELPPALMVKILTELLESHAEPEPPEDIPQHEEQFHGGHTCDVTPERLLDRLDQASEEEQQLMHNEEVCEDLQLSGDVHVHEDVHSCEDWDVCEQSQVCEESSQICEDPQYHDDQHEFYDDDAGDVLQDLYEDLPQRLRRHVIQWGDPVPLTEEDLLSRAHDIETFWFFETRERILNKLPEFAENPAPPLECIAEYPPDWPQWRIDSFDLREAARAARSNSLTPKSRRTPPTPVLLGAFGEVEVT